MLKSKKVLCYEAFDEDGRKFIHVSPIVAETEREMDEFIKNHPDLDICDWDRIPHYFWFDSGYFPEFDYQEHGVIMRHGFIGDPTFTSDCYNLKGEYILTQKESLSGFTALVIIGIAHEKEIEGNEVNILNEIHLVVKASSYEEAVAMLAESIDTDDYQVVSPDMIQMSTAGLYPDDDDDDDEFHKLLVMPTVMKSLGGGVYEGLCIEHFY